MIKFNRILRQSHMKRGWAVDNDGRLWVGFDSRRSGQQVLASGFLGSVGICCQCGERVYEGWSHLANELDLCDTCVKLPAPERIFVVEITSKKFQKLQERFVADPAFTC